MDFTVPFGRVAYAVETLALGDDAAHGPTATNLKDGSNRPCEFVIVTVTDNTVHWTCHGTAPTAAAGTNVGLVADAPSVIHIHGQTNIANFLAINEVAGGGADAVVKIHYFS